MQSGVDVRRFVAVWACRIVSRASAVKSNLAGNWRQLNASSLTTAISPCLQQACKIRSHENMPRMASSARATAYPATALMSLTISSQESWFSSCRKFSEPCISS